MPRKRDGAERQNFSRAAQASLPFPRAAPHPWQLSRRASVRGSATQRCTGGRTGAGGAPAGGGGRPLSPPGTGACTRTAARAAPPPAHVAVAHRPSRRVGVPWHRRGAQRGSAGRLESDRPARGSARVRTSVPPASVYGGGGTMHVAWEVGAPGAARPFREVHTPRQAPQPRAARCGAACARAECPAHSWCLPSARAPNAAARRRAYRVGWT